MWKGWGHKDRSAMDEVDFIQEILGVVWQRLQTSFRKEKGENHGQLISFITIQIKVH